MRGFRVSVGLLLVVLVVAGAAWGARQADEPQPWRAGNCYRATLIGGDLHSVRVLEDPQGTWVRVQADPMSPKVPGASARAPVWLNTALVFTLQQIECATFPHE